MLDAYTKIETDSFKSQLQTVLTAFYQDIKQVTGASGGRKSKVVTPRFHYAAPRPVNDSVEVDGPCEAAALAPAAAADADDAEAVPHGEEPPAAGTAAAAAVAAPSPPATGDKGRKPEQG